MPLSSSAKPEICNVTVQLFTQEIIVLSTVIFPRNGGVRSSRVPFVEPIVNRPAAFQTRIVIKYVVYWWRLQLLHVTCRAFDANDVMGFT